MELTKHAFKTTLHPEDPCVRDHRVHGVRILPGVFLIDLVLRIVHTQDVDLQRVALTDVVFREPIATTTASREIRVDLESTGDGAYAATVRSRTAPSATTGGASTWSRHMTATLVDPPEGDGPHAGHPDAWRDRSDVVDDADAMYAFSRSLNIVHDDFMRIRGTLRRGPDFLMADAELGDLAQSYLDSFFVHPALLDFSTLLPYRVLEEGGHDVGGKPFIPIHVERVRFLRRSGTACVVRVDDASVESTSNEIVKANLALYTADGTPAVRLDGFRAKRIREDDLIRRLEADTPSGADTSSAVAVKQPSGDDPLASKADDDADPASTDAPADDVPAESADPESVARERVRAWVRAKMDDASAPIPLDAEFYSFGLDSTHLLGMVDTIEEEIGETLYPTLLFEHTSVRDLAAFLADEFPDAFARPTSSTASDADESAEDPEHTSDRQKRHEERGRSETVRGSARRSIASSGDGAPTSSQASPIAIVGVAGRYPGASTLDAYWTLLANGVDAVTEVPEDRWDVDAFYSPEKDTPGATYSRWGGYLDDVDAFDSLLFNISPHDAERMAPQERIFLETVWETFENAAYGEDRRCRCAPSTEGGASVGVFTGVMWNDYQLFGWEAALRGAPVMAGSWASSVPNRVSYALNLTGPSMPVDTACSSSLYAIHLAAESLRRGECDMALAGGVNLSLHPYKYVKLSELRMLSSDGVCRSFGAGGDGYVPAEGAGAVLLKPLDEAVADGDRIHAVLRGSAVNHNGHTSGFSVPSPTAQAHLIRDAMRAADVDPRTVGMIEGQGTGTELGDALEAAGLREAFRDVADDHPGCSLGSVKSNVGHAEAAAGVASVTKAILCLKNQQLVPSLHAREPNEKIDFQGTPFRIQQEPAHWPRPVVDVEGVSREQPRRAGISAFGAGGTNVHLILEEYDETQPAYGTSRPTVSLFGARTETVVEDGAGPALVPLSANTPDRLRAVARRLLHALEETDGADRDVPLTLDHLAFTLQQGRDALNARVAIVADDLDGVRHGLRDVLDRFEETSPRTAPRTSAATWVRGNALDGDASSDEPVGLGDVAFAEMNAADRRDALLDVAQQWVKGTPVRWTTLPAHAHGRPLTLPTYPFENVRHWIDTGDVDVTHEPLSMGRRDGNAASERSALDRGASDRGEPNRNGSGRDAPVATPSETVPDMESAVPRTTPSTSASTSVSNSTPTPTASTPGPADGAGRTPRSFDGPDLLYYTESWTSAPTPTAMSLGGDDVVLVVGDDDESADAVRTMLRQVGADPIRVRRGDEYVRFADDTFAIRFEDAEDVQRLLETLDADGRAPSDVLCLWTSAGLSSESETSGRWSDPHVTLHAITRGLMQARLGRDVALTCVSAGRDVDPSRAALSGFFRTLQLESPRLSGRVVHVDAPVDTQALAKTCVREVSASGAAEVRYGDDGRAVHSFAPVEMDGVHPEDVFRRRGVFLVSGGAGKLGLHVARYLADQVDARLVLLGRSPLSEAQKSDIEAIEARGGAVVYLQCDVTDPNQVRDAVEQTRDRFGALHGVIHAAGVVDDALILNTPVEAVQGVTAPKVQGTLNLDRATRDCALDAFVLFSSASASMGNLGQSDYATANRFMDAFAERRAQWAAQGTRSGTTVSIGWPLWAEGGMTIPDESADAVLGDAGLRLLGTDDALAGFAQAVAMARSHVLVLDGERDAVEARLASAAGTALADVVTPSPSIVDDRDSAPSDSPIESTKAATPANPDATTEADTPTDEAAREAVVEDVAHIWSELLKVPRSALDVRASIDEYGVDSIMMARIVEAVQEAYDVEVLPGLLIDHPTIASLAEYLVDEEGVGPRAHAPDASDADTSTSDTSAATATPSTASEPAGPAVRRSDAGDAASGASDAEGTVAVVGLSVRLPQSPTLDAYWENLRAGRDLVTDVPAGRWDARAVHHPEPGTPNRTYTSRGAYLDGIDRFDAAHFGIDADEARWMDPQQRLLLEQFQRVLDRAGYDAADVRGTQTATFIGASPSTYVRDRYRSESDARSMLVNGLQNMAAARIADQFDLRGPAQTIDTACSSSLVALHHACRSLRTGECDAAVAGGAELLLDPFVHIGLSQNGALAPDGVTRVFDRSADGFAIGEGVGLVLLKRYEEARRDGDRILGLIRGSAVNNDGSTVGLTVPSSDAQVDLIDAGLRDAGVDARLVSYLEAHGSGTLIGDPTEVHAAARAFGRWTDRRQYCGIGSVASNTGNLLHAGGVAAFAKVVLGLRHAEIPPTIHFEAPHPKLRFEETPFYPVRESQPWPRIDGRRIAGVSAFGFGGTNCHVVVEAFEADRAGYTPVRQPHPLTTFDRRRYWLDDVRDSATSPSQPLPAASEAPVATGSGTSPDRGSADASSSNTNSVEGATLRGRVVDAIRALVADLRAVEASDVDPELSFLDAGLTSVDLTQLSGRVETRFEIDLLPSVFFDHVSVDALADYLVDEYPDALTRWARNEGDDPDSDDSSGGSRGAPGGGVPGHRDRPDDAPGGAPGRSVPPPSGDGWGAAPRRDRGAPSRDEANGTPIAIVGMAGQVGPASTLDAFWEGLYRGRDFMQPIPEARWDRWGGRDAVGAFYCDAGAFVDDVEAFDASFFHISPREAEAMDPQIRLLLQSLYHAAEDAGMSASIRGSNTGVYTGVSYRDYEFEMIRWGGPVGAHDSVGTSVTMAANRPSYHLDLKGPSVALDTACSSSLTTLHLACRALQRGECDRAFAAGANLILSPRHYQYFCEMGALSSTGRCHSFDAAADGYVPAEAVVTLLLKPLDCARADGDRIRGVIEGSSIRHGGETSSLTAPSPQEQARVIRDAWTDAGIDPATLDYVEAHGTGTELGDPIEIEGLKAAFQSFGVESDAGRAAGCTIGSAKAHVGHAEAAAGVVGVAKTLLSMEAETLPAMPHFDTLNPHVDLDDGPLSINRAPKPWPPRDDAPRRAVVSSFGFGGSNAHVVLRAPTTPPTECDLDPPYVIPLSASAPDRVRALARAMRDAARRHAIAADDAANPFARVAATLQTGREPMNERIAVVAASPAALADGLDAYLNGEADANVFTGTSRADAEASESQSSTASTHARNGAVEARRGEARRWVRGGEVTWRTERLHPRPTPVDLPLYPFDDTRYWFTDALDLDRPATAIQTATPASQGTAPAAENTDRETRGINSTPDPTSASSPVVLVVGADDRPDVVEAVARTSALPSIRLVLMGREPLTDARRDWLDGLTSDATSAVYLQSRFDAPDDLDAGVAYARAAFGPPSALVLAMPASDAPDVTDSSDAEHLRIVESVVRDEPVQTIVAVSAEASTSIASTALDALDVPPECTRTVVTSGRGDDVVDGLAATIGDASAAESFPPSAPGHATSGDDLAESLMHELSDLAVDVLRLRDDRVDPDEELSVLGFESLTLTEYAGDVSDTLGVSVSPATLYEYKTLRDLTAHLIDRFAPTLRDRYCDEGTVGESSVASAVEPSGESAPASGAARRAASSPGDAAPPTAPRASATGRPRSASPEDTRRDVAVVGMSGLFPASPDLRTFWTHLVEGTDMLSPLPRDRFAWEGDDVPFAADRGGFLDDIRSFDPLFFDIAPTEAEKIDPQQRLFLQTAWGAVEDAGYRASDLAGTSTGVFLGISNFGYYDVLADANAGGAAHALTGMAATAAPNRVSYLMDLHGPSEPVDTGCSSSLVALHRGIQSIRSGESSTALVGGVNLLVSHKPFLTTTRAGMLSPNGRCATFSEGADGYVRAEGVCTVMIKPLDEALDDGDSIYAVVKGSALNHGGHVKEGMTAPNPHAQAECLSRAYEDAEVDPATISYIEAHGSGTELGDPIEINGIKRAFRRFDAADPDRAVPCAVGSVKTNAGHLESAAGIAGFVKTVLALRNGVLPGNLHFDTLNPYVEIDDSPLSIASETRPWTRPTTSDGTAVPRRAGVSSFGFGGVNAHVVLEEAPPRTDDRTPDADDTTHLVPLSARTPDALRRRAADLRDVLASGVEHGDGGTPTDASGTLADVAYTLQVGREPMAHRLAVRAASTAEAVEALNVYLDADGDDAALQDAPVHVGQGDGRGETASFVRESRDGHAFVQSLVDQRALEGVARLWVDGAEIPWADLHDGTRRRVSLPTYPFEKQRCWISDRPLHVSRDTDHAPPAHRETEASPTASETSRTNGQQAGGQRARGPVATGAATGDGALPGPTTTPDTSTATPSDATAPPTVEQIVAFVRQTVSDVVGVAIDEIDPDVSVRGYGVDSIVSMNVLKTLEETFGPLPKDLFFRHDTLREAAHFIADRAEDDDVRLPGSDGTGTETPPSHSAHEAAHEPEPEASDDTDASEASVEATPAGDGVRPTSASPRPTPRVQTSLRADDPADVPIAVVGVGGRFPGAETASDLWDIVVEGQTPVREVPNDRFDLHAFVGDPDRDSTACSTSRGAFIDDVAGFDPYFFGITPREATLMDPQQRLFLEIVWRTIEDAGYRASDLAGTDVGVFAGASSFDYLEVLRDHDLHGDAHASTGISHSIISNRISFLLDLHGPSETVDTACSSSLVAVHRAMRSIRAGDCAAAIAGGVQLMLEPTLWISYSQAGFLAPDAVPRPFDASATGFVRGEGAGAVLLKPLADAIENGDHVYAVLRGSAVNHSGRTQSLTVPNAQAQAQVIADAMASAGVDPRTIRYVETHGTGTPVGDPIEVEGLRSGFRRDHPDLRRVDDPFCGLTSVKSNVGHLEAGAGIASLLKVLFSLRHHRVPKVANFETPNPHLGIEASPFYVIDENETWERTHTAAGEVVPRRAGISSFGFGGTNAHLVVEEFVSDQSPASQRPDGDQLIVLSARSDAALRTYAARLRDALATTPVSERPSLRDVAFTLRVGREPMAHRMAVVASTIDRLVDVLDAVAREDAVPSRVVVGRAASSDDEEALRGAMRDAIRQVDLDAAARLWVDGAPLDVEADPAAQSGRRVSLPTYPFERMRCWPGDPAPRGESRSRTTASTDSVANDAEAWTSLLRDLKHGDLSVDEAASAIDLDG